MMIQILGNGCLTFIRASRFGRVGDRKHRGHADGFQFCERLRIIVPLREAVAPLT